MFHRLLFFLALLIGALIGIGNGYAEDEYERAIAEPDDSAAVAAFLSTLPEIPEGSGRYFVEGDLYLDQESVVAYLKSNGTPPKPLPEGELIVNVVGGSLDYLKSSSRRKLTYAVVSSKFPTPESAKKTNKQLKTAAWDWIAACGDCGITLTEVPIEQAGKFYEKVTFVLTYLDTGGGPIARSFFPSSPSDERQIVIFPDFFSDELKFNQVGVLRHEFGHILGYRHGQLDPKSRCVVGEAGQWKQLTPYDAKSVMHYMCGRGGTYELKLSKADKDGHRCLYGNHCAKK